MSVSVLPHLEKVFTRKRFHVPAIPYCTTCRLGGVFFRFFLVDGANWLSPGHHTLRLTCGPAGRLSPGHHTRLPTTPQAFFFPFFFVDGANWLSPGHHTLRLTCGPAGNRTATGSLSATSRTSPYQLLHRDACGVFFSEPVAFGGSTVLSVTCGPAGESNHHRGVVGLVSHRTC